MHVLAIYAFDKLVVATEIDKIAADVMAMPSATAVKRALDDGISWWPGR